MKFRIQEHIDRRGENVFTPQYNISVDHFDFDSNWCCFYSDDDVDAYISENRYKIILYSLDEAREFIETEIAFENQEIKYHDYHE